MAGRVESALKCDHVEKDNADAASTRMNARFSARFVPAPPGRMSYGKQPTLDEPRKF